MVTGSTGSLFLKGVLGFLAAVSKCIPLPHPEAREGGVTGAVRWRKLESCRTQ